MKGLFDFMMKIADMPSAETALIERAIGCAILDKIKGHKSLPSQIFITMGGSRNNTIDTILSKLDANWHNLGNPSFIKKIEQEVSPGGKPLSQVYGNIAAHELALVERTIGKGVLSEMRGKKCHLVQIYNSLGGTHGITQKVFSDLGKYWANVNVDNTLAVIDA